MVLRDLYVPGGSCRNDLPEEVAYLYNKCAVVPIPLFSSLGKDRSKSRRCLKALRMPSGRSRLEPRFSREMIISGMFSFNVLFSIFFCCALADNVLPNMRAAIHDLYCLMMLYLLIEAKLDIPNGVRIIRIKEEIVLFTVLYSCDSLAGSCLFGNEIDG